MFAILALSTKEKQMPFEGMRRGFCVKVFTIPWLVNGLAISTYFAVFVSGIAYDMGNVVTEVESFA